MSALDQWCDDVIHSTCYDNMDSNLVANYIRKTQSCTGHLSCVPALFNAKLSSELSSCNLTESIMHKKALFMKVRLWHWIEEVLGQEKYQIAHMRHGDRNLG